MYSIFKKLLFLWTLFFTSFLFADDGTVNIDITNPRVNESEGKITFTITLSQRPIFPVKIFYRTLDGTAKSGEDYDAVAKDFVYFGGGLSSRDVDINILNDNIYETTQEFYLDITTIPLGYVSKYDATGTIDDDDTMPLSLYLHNQTIKETDVSGNVVNFTAELNQKAPAGGVKVTYETSDGSAKETEDYIGKSSFIFIPEGSSRGFIAIDIVGDTIFENPNTEDFNLKITSVSAGGIKKGSAICTIEDDDEIEVDITSYDADEGNVGDNNQLKFKIFLKKAYPLTNDLTIKYATEDGATPSATVGVDYKTNSGSVVFKKGEIEKFVYVDIIGDIEIEENEKVRMVITGSKYIIDSESEALILNDDGSFPGITFSKKEFSIIEGNSSQTFLDFNFTLSEPALDGASFTYDTWDETAEDDALDNDYIYTHGEYKLTAGEKKIKISVPINGDRRIENNESFHFGISKLHKLTLDGDDEAIGTIINDDGSYPAIKFEDRVVSEIEGNSGTKNLEFLVTFNQPAFKSSSFTFIIEDIDTNSTDYVALTKNTYSFAGGETNATIVVKVKGDIEVETDESFRLKVINENNFTIEGDRFSIGKIINDDVKNNPFTCTEQSYLFTSDQNASYTDYYSINLSSGIAKNEKRFATSHINATGYNVQDNYIYGFEYGSNTSDVNNSYNVVRIDSEFNVKQLHIEGLSKRRFYLGDVSFDGVYYLANRDEPFNNNTLQEIQRVDLNSTRLLSKITLRYDLNTTKIKTADFAFNPKDKQLYMVNSVNNQLVRVNKDSGRVEELGYVGNIGDTYSVISFFDVDGNFYFYTKGTEKIYKINISNPSNIDATAIEFNDMSGLINSGDGARCANAPVTPPIKIDEPLVCDSSMYLSSSIKRGTGEEGRMWLHKINTQTNPFTFDVIDDAGDSNRYNALAYSDAGDKNSTNFIFALFKDELLKIGKSGRTMSLGKIDKLSALLSQRQFFAGAIYDGFYYISGPGVEYNKIFKISLSDKNVTEIILSDAISLLDFSFTPDGKFLHGVIDGGKLVKIEVVTGKVTFIGNAHIGYQFDSSFSDKNGRFFANDSKGNGFFEFNLKTGEKLFLSNSQKAEFNDGANCLKEALIFTDYGDAPSTYGMPSHNISNGLFLGSGVDHDVKPYYSPKANGDDTNGTDDEDGVTFIDGTDINGSYFELKKIHELKVIASKKGYLNAWIDLNADGDFKDSGEKIFSEKLLSAGSTVVKFKLPVSASSNKKSYLRVRFSSTKNLDSTSHANDGEVEDYVIYLGSKVLRGKFNIERTNSGLDSIMSSERNAWYTQVVGNDFDYSLVFYDEKFTKEQNISRIVARIELVDTKSDKPLYERYIYISDSSSNSRFTFDSKNSPSDDLSEQTRSSFPSIPASKDVHFRVTYPKDNAGNIIQSVCKGDAKTCFESLKEIQYDDAQDNFAIRPHNFYVALSDKGTMHQDSISKNVAASRVAAGYDYNLTIVATKYPLSSTVPARGYNTFLDRHLVFKTVGSCADESNVSTPIAFNDGINSDLNFTHNNAGQYLLHLEDALWTKIDSNKTIPDCILKDNSVSTQKGTVRSGCDINTVSNMMFSFYPYKFKVDFSLHNLPSNSHDDFIYMSDMNNTENNVSLQFKGSITAQSKNNITSTNFTKSCVATDVQLVPDVSVLVDDGLVVHTGTPSRIRTANYKNKKREDVNVTRMARFNDEILSPVHFSHMFNFDRGVEILSEKFLDEKNGTLSLDLRYNIQKNLSLPINPVQVTLHALKVEAPMAWSEAERRVKGNSFIPVGKQDLADVERNFYFAQVASDKILYPRVNFTVTKVIRTPLNVDIFCNASEAYCSQTKFLANTKITSSARKQDGWYLSTNHDKDKDGMVTGLSPSPTIVTTTATPIKLTHGRNGIPTTRFTNCNVPKSVVSITSSPALSFYPNGKLPYYVVECISKEASEWTGIGQAGNVLENQSNVKIEGKMDW